MDHTTSAEMPLFMLLCKFFTFRLHFLESLSQINNMGFLIEENHLKSIRLFLKDIINVWFYYSLQGSAYQYPDN